MYIFLIHLLNIILSSIPFVQLWQTDVVYYCSWVEYTKSEKIHFEDQAAIMCNYVADYQIWNTGSRWRSNVCWIQCKLLLSWWGCYSSYCTSCCWRSLNMHVIVAIVQMLLTFFSVWTVELSFYSIFLFLFPAFSYVLGSEISTSYSTISDFLLMLT
jgi:hypothetical protein